MLQHGDLGVEILQGNRGYKMSQKYKATTVGNIKVEAVDELPVYNSTDLGRILYDNDTEQLYYGSEVGGGSFRNLFDIPKSSIVLFESDTAILGYTLLTGVNDSLVYVTKGLDNEGDPGGGWKTNSTWVQPVHRHNLNNHTHTGEHTHTVSHSHTVSAHNHQWFQYGIPSDLTTGYTWESNGSTMMEWNNGIEEAIGLVVTSENDGEAHIDNSLGSFWTENTTETINSNNVTTSAEDVLSSTPSNNYTTYSTQINSWRPKGRNFTRQRRD
jgi:hypothetical protein